LREFFVAPGLLTRVCSMTGRRAQLILLACVAGCGGAPAQPPPPTGTGTVVVEFMIKSPAETGLTLTGGQLSVEYLDLFGDVSQTPQASARVGTLNLVSTTTQNVTLTGLPQGVYSRVILGVEGMSFTGSYNGTPVQAHFEIEGARPALTASPAPDLLPGKMVTLPVTVDENAWFSGVSLDQATVTNGTILIDLNDNLPIAQMITAALASSFSIGVPVSGPIQ
jgi:hypothetical protein